MSNIQTILNDAGRLAVTQRIWNDGSLIPAYVAIFLLSYHGLVALRPFWGLHTRFDGAFVTPGPTAAPARAQGILSEAKQRVQAQGVRLMLLRFLRLLGAMTLVGLSITALLSLEGREEAPASASPTPIMPGEQIKPKNHRKSSGAAFSHDEWIEVSHIIIYVRCYSSLLSLAALISRQGSTAGGHLTIVMLAVVAVYTYRDLYPLATFTLIPKDGHQAWLLWSRIAIASIMAIVIPLVTPTKLLDPLESAHVAEQTASWWSFLTYTFLDPIIWLAAQTPHLPYEQLPPLANYDRAEHLVEKSERVLDPFLRQKKTHIFWGLLRYFAWECVQLIFMIVVMTFAGFVAPIGINRLLLYLEDGGESAVFRPWVWILLLFVGPNLVSVTMQYYGFITTRTLVRTQCILTQLVFDHALRIRINEGTGPSNAPGTTVPNRPRTQYTTSENEAGNEVEGDREGETTESGAGTSQVNCNTSTTPSTRTPSKGKGKVNDSHRTAPEIAGAGPDHVTPKEARVTNLVGKINNHVTTDLENIVDGRDLLFVVLYGPLQLALSVWFLYAILDWSGLVGMSVMIISIPLPGYLLKLLNKVQSERMKKTDAQVQTVTEILSVIRMTKLFGWQKKVGDQIAEKREAELHWLKKRRLLGLLHGNLNFFFPLLTMLVTFATYVCTRWFPSVLLGMACMLNLFQTIFEKKELTASVVFSSIPVFDKMQQVLYASFSLIPVMVNAKVSLSRINEFLLNTELLDRFTGKNKSMASEIVLSHMTIDPNTIGFRNASFSWSANSREGPDTPPKRHFRLNILGDLFFQSQRFNLIIGPTGSGKTSLLMALLGEMHFEPIGEHAGYYLPRDGGVAYAAQEGWVQNETIKDNILFGRIYDEQRYNQVIHQCALGRDLSLFEAGDASQVGEKGLTLSGGQKARITLARAVYSDAKILLLDDILAALDVHTATFIVEECFQGNLLKGRTIVLVTHSVAMVYPISTFVVSLGLDGRIANQGTVSDALPKDSFLQEVAEMNEIVEKAEQTADVVEPEKIDENKRGKLMVAEDIQLGHVGWPALKLYLSSLGGPWFWSTVFIGVTLSELLLVLSQWFLGFWASKYYERPGWAVPVAYYLGLYALILISIMATYTIAFAVFVVGSIRASRAIHRKLIQSILGTTLRWLDTVPTARIIARCTQDIRVVDGPINECLGDVIDLTISLVIKFSAVLLFVPIFVLPGIAVLLVGGLCGQLYIKAQMSVKREMSNSRSPVLAHFGAAISGLTSIRAYGAQAAFREESLKRIDGYTRPARTFYNFNRWVCIRMDAIGGLFSAGLATYLVYVNGLRTASNTGFSLTMAVGFSGMILWWVRVLNEFEVEGNSLERIEGYVNIEQEAEATDSSKPPAYWPASGAIKVEKLSARYSADGPKVLHDISFEVKSGERIGVVGRTGSGKSSLTLSLLRCIPTEGRITFDGLATDSINLDALRSSITIIPQIPELLNATLRENLDPFSEHSDSTLNDALQAAGLFRLEGENKRFKITLDSSISSGGGNLSVGQRQILALARAIVRRSKLLILDEATSAIDYTTDTIIQNTLRVELKDATLITVAHRLQTIMDADKIMVLDAGRMVEFDSPANLLKQDDGYFRSLVDGSGDRDKLYKMAKKAKESSS